MDVPPDASGSARAGAAAAGPGALAGAGAPGETWYSERGGAGVGAVGGGVGPSAEAAAWPAAVASGWLSAVDPAAWVARVSRLFPFVDRPENMGLTPLTEWLAARGVEAGPAFVRALRHEWLMTRMAVESRRN